MPRHRIALPKSLFGNPGVSLLGECHLNITVLVLRRLVQASGNR